MFSHRKSASHCAYTRAAWLAPAEFFSEERSFTSLSVFRRQRSSCNIKDETCIFHFCFSVIVARKIWSRSQRTGGICRRLGSTQHVQRAARVPVAATHSSNGISHVSAFKDLTRKKKPSDREYRNAAIMNPLRFQYGQLRGPHPPRLVQCDSHLNHLGSGHAGFSHRGVFKPRRQVRHDASTSATVEASSLLWPERGGGRREYAPRQRLTPRWISLP